MYNGFGGQFAEVDNTPPPAAAPAAPSAGAGRGFVNPTQGATPVQSATPATPATPVYNGFGGQFADTPTPAYNGFAPTSGNQSQSSNAAVPVPSGVPSSSISPADKAIAWGNKPSIAESALSPITTPITDAVSVPLKMAADFLTSKAAAIAGDTSALGAQALNSVTQFVGDKLGWSPKQIAALQTNDPMAIREDFQQAGNDIQNFTNKALTPAALENYKSVNNAIAPVTNVISGLTRMTGGAVSGLTGNPVLGQTVSDLLDYKAVPEAAGSLVKAIPSDPVAAVQSVRGGFQSTLTNPVWKDATGNDVAPPDFKPGSKVAAKEQMLTDENGQPKYFTANGQPITSVYQSNQGMTTSRGPVGSYVDENGNVQPSVKASPSRIAASVLTLGNEMAGTPIPGTSWLSHIYGFTKVNQLMGAIKENYGINEAARKASDSPLNSKQFVPMQNTVAKSITGIANDNPSDNSEP